MAVTIAGITCQEEVHDYSEEYDMQGGPSAHKVYLCPWANRFTVIHGILGLTSVPTLGGLISLNVPMQYPELAAESTNLLASMYARNVVCTGVGSPAQGANNITFTTARIVVTFGNYPWTFSGIDYFQLDPTRPLIWVEQHMEFSGEFITIPGLGVYYATSGIQLGAPNGQANWGFFNPIVDMTLTLKNVPYLPAQQVLTASQKPLNSVTYLNCAPGFLMFKGLQDDRTHAPDGTPTGSMTLGFSFRPIAQWDCVWSGIKSGTGTYKPSGTTPPFWDQVLSAPAGNPVQGHSDLSQIIPAAYGT